MLKNINLAKIGNDYGNILNDFKLKKLIFNYLFNEIKIENFKELEITNNSILKNIRNNNYKAIKLSSGNNYILLLKEINNIYFSLLIKKNFSYNFNDLNYNNLEIFSLDILYPSDYYKGTILEGRLEKLNDTCVYNIYNIIKLKNHDIVYNLDEKYNIIKNNFEKIENKFFQFKCSNLIDIKDIDDNNYFGLLFVPNNYNLNKYYIYFENKIIKEYCNLYMKKITTDVYYLYSKEKKKIGIAHIPNIKTSHYFTKYENEIIVKCWYNFNFNKWVPFELLDDDNIVTDYNNVLNKTIKI